MATTGKRRRRLLTSQGYFSTIAITESLHRYRSVVVVGRLDLEPGRIEERRRVVGWPVHGWRLESNAELVKEIYRKNRIYPIRCLRNSPFTVPSLLRSIVLLGFSGGSTNQDYRVNNIHSTTRRRFG